MKMSNSAGLYLQLHQKYYNSSVIHSHGSDDYSRKRDLASDMLTEKLKTSENIGLRAIVPAHLHKVVLSVIACDY